MSETMTAARSRNTSTDGRTMNWIFWKVALPLFFFILLWPMYAIVLGIDHPFQRAFAHGELMLFSALVLIEAAVESEQARSTKMQFCRQFAMVLAVLFIFIFGFIRSDVIKEEIRLAKLNVTASERVLDKLRGYACFNCSVTVFAVAFGLYSFWAGVEGEHLQRLKNLGEGD